MILLIIITCYATQVATLESVASERHLTWTGGGGGGLNIKYNEIHYTLHPPRGTWDAIHVPKKKSIAQGRIGDRSKGGSLDPRRKAKGCMVAVRYRPDTKSGGRGARGGGRGAVCYRPDTKNGRGGGGGRGLFPPVLRLDAPPRHYNGAFPQHRAVGKVTVH